MAKKKKNDIEFKCKIEYFDKDQYNINELGIKEENILNYGFVDSYTVVFETLDTRYYFDRNTKEFLSAQKFKRDPEEVY